MSLPLHVLEQITKMYIAKSFLISMSSLCSQATEITFALDSLSSPLNSIPVWLAMCVCVMIGHVLQSTSGKPSMEYVELIAGSDVYISSHKLEEATRDAKTGTQLARKLMDAFWDKDTLARSTLTPRSKFQYQQLDPKVIKTIEGMCYLCT